MRGMIDAGLRQLRRRFELCRSCAPLALHGRRRATVTAPHNHSSISCEMQNMTTNRTMVHPLLLHSAYTRVRPVHSSLHSLQQLYGP